VDDDSAGGGVVHRFGTGRRKWPPAPDPEDVTEQVVVVAGPGETQDIVLSAVAAVGLPGRVVTGVE
jgi:hypothetical protein